MKLIDGDALKAKMQQECDMYKGSEYLADKARRDELYNVIACIVNAPDAVTRCCECKYWDKNSGLTARACKAWCKFTTQYEFCARGKKRGNAD